MTKTLTLTSEFFQNECAESFCKAIQGNMDTEGMEFVASKSDGRRFVFYDDVDMRCVLAHGVTFQLDDSFSVDWTCLYYCITIGTFEKMIKDRELDLDYLATLQGVIIEEVGE